MHVQPSTVPTLEGAALRRALVHARGCDTCRGPVERVLLATRTLERGTPWEPTEAEVEALGEAGLDRALGAARPRRRWAPLAGLGVALAAGAALLVVVVRPQPEFTARGGGEGRAVLRMFCAAPGGTLRELPPGSSCVAGGKLAFAAAATPGLSSVALRLSGPGGTEVLGPFAVTGQPGAEAPLDVTPELARAGQVDVLAAFAATPRAALDAARGDPGPGAVVLHQQVQIEGAR